MHSGYLMTFSHTHRLTKLLTKIILLLVVVSGLTFASGHLEAGVIEDFTCSGMCNPEHYKDMFRPAEYVIYTPWWEEEEEYWDWCWRVRCKKTRIVRVYGTSVAYRIGCCPGEPGQTWNLLDDFLLVSYQDNSCVLVVANRSTQRPFVRRL
jgi:hypothetical protein